MRASCRLDLWALCPATGRRLQPAVIAGAESNQCGVEVGGGPWWDGLTWSQPESQMRQPFKFLVQAPYRLDALRRRLRGLRGLRRRGGKVRAEEPTEGGA